MNRLNAIIRESSFLKNHAKYFDFFFLIDKFYQEQDEQSLYYSIALFDSLIFFSTNEKTYEYLYF